MNFYLRYASRALRRGGQRTLLALVCIAFGVMSLIAMQSLGALFIGLIATQPQLMVGGDVVLLPQGNTLDADAIAKLDQLRASGILERYTLVAETFEVFLRTPGNGHAYIVQRARGIDPRTYPLVGTLHLQGSSAPSLADALASPHGAILTRDVADALGLKEGDTFTFSDSNAPFTLYVTAIADQTPEGQGNAVYYSLDTARLIAGRDDVATNASAFFGPNANDSTPDQLREQGWFLRLATDNDPQQQAIVNLFDYMFKGAGILGLIIGGIGVANTMQVLLARRTTEIAVLKTLGYRQADLLFLFGIETTLLGVIGSLLGAVAAVGLSAGLVSLLARTLSLLVAWSLNPLILVGGIAAGIATTLVFGIYAIVRANGVRPASLLRQAEVMPTFTRLVSTLGLILLLLLVFTAICTIIMGSLVGGLGIIAFSIVGLIVLTLLFGGLLFVLLRLPLPSFGLLTLARNSLKRRQMRAVFALIALFAGVFTIGFAAMIISNASQRFASHDIALDGDNVFIFATPGDLPVIRANFIQQKLPLTQVRYELPIKVTAVESITYLEGRDSPPADLSLSGAAWGSSPDGVYVPADSGLKGTVTLITPDRQAHTLPIVGTYAQRSARTSPILARYSGNMIASKDTLLQLGGSAVTLITVGAAPVDQLTPLGDQLGRALPAVTVLTLADINEAMQRIFRNLFLLAIAVAGLALVAGAVLIANSVGLATVERRREIGILKSVGYNQRHILSMIVLEQGLLGLFSGVVGMVGVAIAILLIDATQPDAKLAFNTLQAVVMVAVSIGIALASAGLVAWHPTRIRPLAVLRDE